MTGTPIAGKPARQEHSRSHSSRESLVPGALIATRYRLIRRFEGPRWIAWWHAHDTDLRRDVALSLLDSEYVAETDGGQNALARFCRNTTGTSFSREGRVARVYDIVILGHRVVVVTEWTPGWLVSEVARSNPTPVAAARMVRHLATATAAAHHLGACIGLDHPNRVRISRESRAIFFAFPATLAHCEKTTDILGLGGLLYALLVGTWPLAFGQSLIAGLPPAPRKSDGSVVEPHSLRPEVPPELSAVTMNALAEHPASYTAGELVEALDQALATAERSLGPEPSPAVVPAPTTSVRRMTPSPTRTPWRHSLTAVSAATALLVGLGAIGWTIGTSFPTADSPSIVAAKHSLAHTAPGPEAPSSPAIALTNPNATVYSPQEFPDGQQAVPWVFDADPATEWTTALYSRQFPAAENAVGLIVSFPAPVDLEAVRIESRTPGSTVEIRTAPVDAGDLEHTRILGSATLDSGITRIPLAPHDSLSRVLVWITGLSQTEAGFQTALAEVSFEGK